MTDSFIPEPVLSPSTIEDISIHLFDGVSGKNDISYSYQVRLSDGSMKVKTGNLIPYLTQGQINQLQGVMSAIRAKVTDEVI